MDAQRQQIESFCTAEGITILHTFVEVESGRKNDRVELHNAIRTAKALGCPVVVAKLDRLSRQVHFISGLMAQGVPFVVAELGLETPSLLLHIFAAVAENESKAIGDRVKRSMAAAKDRGAVFGNPRWEESLPEIREMGHEANRQRGDSSFWRVLPFLKDGSKAGCTGTSSFVRYLNERGCFTPRGKDWKQGSLYRFVKRAKAEGFIPA